MSRNDERPRVNTFTASSVKRDSDEKLSYCEMYPHECAEIFDSDITNGLSIKQVKKQRKKYGYNIITAPVPLSFGESLKKQAKNLLVLFMFFSCIMMWIYERNNLYIIAASGVLTLIFINACLEHSAGKALNEKQKYSLPSVTVLRGGKQFVADSRSLVCGDVIFLEENRIVPADARLIEC
ncbi:MAG: cation-transporting P-type ATPase, partial [Clostridia bacterium]